MLSIKLTSIVFLIISLHQAQAYDLWQFIQNPLSLFDNLQVKSESAEVMTNAEKLNSATEYMYGCSCKNFTCSCCSHLSLGIFNINNTACLSITYSNQDPKLELSFNLDTNTIYNTSIADFQSPLPCFQVPLYRTGGLCLTFKEIEANNNSLSACTDLVVKLGHEDLVTVKLGCFKLADSTVFNSESKMGVYASRTDQAYFYDQMDSLEKSGRYLMKVIGRKFNVQKLAYKYQSN